MADDQPAIIGRPTIYSDDLADEICERLASGQESLRGICQDERMPHIATVCRWLADDARRAFREQYTRAREAQAEGMIDDALELADRAAVEATVPQVGGQLVQARRLQVDLRKWALARMSPKRWGDRQQVDLGGAGEPVKLEHRDEELPAEVRERLAELGRDAARTTPPGVTKH